MRSIILIFAVVIVQSLACSNAKPTSDATDNQKLQNSETRQPIQSKKVTVLLRRAEISEIAFDGAFFLDGVYTATTKVVSPLKEETILSSTDSLEITEDERYVQVLSPKEKAAPMSDTWKKEPKEFDFTVYWEMKSKEQSKSSFDETLRINVREMWRVELVADPKVTRTWNCAYVLTGGGSFSVDKEEIDQIASQQIVKTIAPARGPILKEVCEFIKINSAEKY